MFFSNQLISLFILLFYFAQLIATFLFFFILHLAFLYPVKTDLWPNLGLDQPVKNH